MGIVSGIPQDSVKQLPPGVLYDRGLISPQIDGFEVFTTSIFPFKVTKEYLELPSTSASQANFRVFATITAIDLSGYTTANLIYMASHTVNVVNTGFGVFPNSQFSISLYPTASINLPASTTEATRTLDISALNDLFKIGIRIGNGQQNPQVKCFKIWLS